MMFEPHPREFFQPDEQQFRITPLNRKLRSFEELGSRWRSSSRSITGSPGFPREDFIERVLVAGLGVAHVIIGYDFYFGHKRGGNPELMVQARRGAGLRRDRGAAASRRPAKCFLRPRAPASGAGRRQGRGAYAGRDVARAGRVVGGAKRGAGLGFPTANVPMPKGTALGHGIYAVRAHDRRQGHNAAAYLGTRPTFDDGMPVLEVFLFDFTGDLYGREIEVEFIDFIRGDRKFHSEAETRCADDEDMAQVRAVLARG